MASLTTEAIRYSTGDLLADATLRLFKALPVLPAEDRIDRVLDMALARTTVASGFVFAPELSARYDHRSLLDMVDRLYGRHPEALNATFHKSFATVRDTPAEVLVLQQILHYLTTYGTEHIGVYDAECVYIPAEQLDAPALNTDIRLVVIRGLTHNELKKELLGLLSGVALGEQTAKDAVEIAKFLGLTEADVLEVRNKEVRAALYGHLGIVPTHPEEFLRVVVYRATGSALLIKSASMVDALKARSNTDLEPLFAVVDLTALARVFYRFKPLFLALRTTPALRAVVNRIRRLATVNHKPLPEDVLNTVTARLHRQDVTVLTELPDALRGASTVRKVRLAYALRFRTEYRDSIVYRIRNGKSWATEFKGVYPRPAFHDAYDIVLASITEDIRKNIGDKRVFAPEGLHYALPTTERQFTGDLPSGTFVKTAGDLVIGVNWENVQRFRVDLDLSLIDARGKIGWDASYRDCDNDIFFSGDVTDATHGASEVFHIGARAFGTWLVSVNFYNWQPDVEVPFKVIAGHDARGSINHNYTVDPNKLLTLANTSMSVKSKTLGVIVADGEGTRFYFVETSLSAGRTARLNSVSEHARNYLVDYYTNAIGLRDVLTAAGAQFAEMPQAADIDLSWEGINKGTLLGLLR